ncbi:MAG TPA: hypothetical protein VGR85_03475 [Candidatus Limnocylindria bacterium]|jgi:hypothetical protein|nr:hypothetical protein [Candidatus Limnocylindria bacterium]
MKTPLVVATLCLLLALGASAHAKEGAVARLHAPVPADAQPGTLITIAWSLVFPESDQPFNACGVFVQLRSTVAAAAPTRAYADGGACRAHPKGEYEATIVVPAGGTWVVEVGLSGTTDIFFPVVPSTVIATSTAPRNELPPDLAVTIIGTAIALAGAIALIAARRTISPRPSM